MFRTEYTLIVSNDFACARQSRKFGGGDGPALAIPHLDFVDVDDPVGIAERQALQQHGVDDREHRGVGADADGQREDDDEGEHRRPSQHAGSVSERSLSLLVR